MPRRNTLRDASIHHGNYTAIKQALVVSANYTGSSIQLNGCEIDGIKMKSFFETRNYQVTTLSETMCQQSGRKDIAPTKANMIAWVARLASTPNLTNMAIVFSGHGTQVKDQNGDENDGMDEAIVCHHPGGADKYPRPSDLFTDDEILSLLRKSFEHKAVDVFLMFDACHSGTICDLGYELKQNNTWSINRRAYKRLGHEQFKSLCISGCKDNQVSLETNGGGSMTNKFLQMSRNGNFSIRALNSGFSEMGLQSPQITAGQDTSLDSIFGDIIIETPNSQAARARSRRKQYRIDKRTLEKFWPFLLKVLK